MEQRVGILTRGVERWAETAGSAIRITGASVTVQTFAGLETRTHVPLIHGLPFEGYLRGMDVGSVQ